MAWRGGLPPPPSTRIPTQQEEEDDAEALAISDQRTLYIVNIFIANTVRFLNSFSSICEDKLSRLHRRMRHLDATLTLLEAKIRGTSCYHDLEDDSCSKTGRNSKQPLPEKSFLNDQSIDPPHGSTDS